MANQNSPSSRPRTQYFSIAALAAVLLFVVLAVGSSLTHRPQVDEALFASPAYNLAYEGHFGTTIFEMENSALTRIDERTYWVMPTFLLNVAASFKIFGFGIFSMRLVSVFWALMLLGAGYYIGEKLSGDRNVGFLSVILLACNYTVLDTASSGRMDLMCAALGFCGLAAYLVWREKNLGLAVLLGQTFVCLAGLTHHNGIMAFVGLAFLIFYFDFRRLGWKHLGFAAIPYLIGGSLFGAYVWQDFEAFYDQFIGNATMGGRLKGFSSPLAGIVAEFTKRYPHAYGFHINSGGHAGPIYLKGLILVGYIAGLAGVLLVKSLRVKYLPLLVLTLIYFVILGVIDGQK